MNNPSIEIDVLCMCGAPASAHGDNGIPHAFAPMRGAGQMRDDQEASDSTRPGHYTLHDYRVIQIANPAAGVDFVATVPSTARWRIKAIQAMLTTAAAVFNRVPHLVVKDAQGNSLYNFPSIQNQVAGSSVFYSAGLGIVAVSFDGATTLVLPGETHLLQQWSIGMLTTGIQAGDQWSAISLVVEEFLSF